MRYVLVGVDEVGRGPIAGPLAVGAFASRKNVLKKHFWGVRDSKKLSPKQREEWFRKIKDLQRLQLVDFSVTFVSASSVDTIGISKALRRAISSCLSKLVVSPERTEVLLDGGIKAPRRFLLQKTIIKGDEKERIIACASIVAKVIRDRRMTRFSKHYPEYGFEVHKGYGTVKHYEALRKYGFCSIHRKSFLQGAIINHPARTTAIVQSGGQDTITKKIPNTNIQKSPSLLEN